LNVIQLTHFVNAVYVLKAAPLKSSGYKNKNF